MTAFLMMVLQAPNAVGIASALVVGLLVVAWSANAPVPPSTHPSALPEQR